MKNLRIGIKKIISLNPVLVSLLFLIILASIFFSHTPLLGLYFLLKIFEILFLIVVLFLDKKSFLSAINFLSLSILIESAIAIIQFAKQSSIGGPLYFLGERNFNVLTPNIANAAIGGNLILRPYGTFPHPNVLAAFLLISISILFLEGLQKGKRFIQITILIGSLTLLLTMSRIPIIIYIFFLMLYLLKQKFKDYRLPLFIISGSFLFFLLTSLHLRFLINLNDESFTQRASLLQSSINMILKNPIFGVGLNNFLPTLPSYQKSQGFFSIQPVHNVLILIASEIGIIAALIVSYLFFLIFKKTNREGKVILSIFLALSFFDHYFLTIQQGQLLLGMVFSYALSKSMIKFNNA